MVLTEVGEVGLSVGDVTHVLRPSLYAMSKLGEPVEIVELFARMMAEPHGEKARWRQFSDALCILHCCADSDISEVVGYFNERLKYVYKKADLEDIITIARHLMRHGIIGVLPEQPRRHDAKQEYTKEFIARDHVAAAMAHLGVSEREAWNMTMTALVGALRSKYPPSSKDSPGANAPTLEEHEATMAWADAVEEKRRKMLEVKHKKVVH